MKLHGGHRRRSLAIIPARGGSKRIPRKNLYPFEGLPMLAHAIGMARATGCFEDVLVSTDCPEIAAVARRYGASVPFMRTEATSHDHAPTFDVVHEVLNQLETIGQKWDIGACIYPTAVLALPEDLAHAIASIARGDAACVMPVTRFDYPIWRALLLESDGTPSYAFTEHANARSQDLAPAYHDAGQWYAFDIAELRASGRFMGHRTRVVVLPPQQVQDIDTLEDLQLAEIKLRARREGMSTLRGRDRPWVLIRVDATPEIGSGHVMRCLALAEAFDVRGYDVVFVSRSCAPEFRRLIEARDFDSVLLEVPPDPVVSEALADATATITWLAQESSRPAWIVVDHYALDAVWEGAIRSCASPLLVLDDLADRPHVCDVLLDQNMISAHHLRYPSLVPEGARLLLGGQYALLRSEFALACDRREELLRQAELHDVVLFMGATDTDNLTLQLAKCLIEHVGAGQLIVLVGYLNPHRQAIETWCQANGVRCELGLADVSAAFQACRLLVAACGMTAVEAQALGIPCLLVSLSPIQHKVAQWFAEHRRAVVLEPHECQDPDSVRNALHQALALEPDVPGGRPISVHGAIHVVDALMEVSYE